MTQQQLDILPGKRVLVNSGEVFIGSHSCKTLLDFVDWVIGLNHLFSIKRDKVLAFLKNSRFLFIKFITRNLQEFRNTCKKTDYTLNHSVLAKRRINKAMEQYVASDIIERTDNNYFYINGAKTVNLGIAFKANCPDAHNTTAVDVINQLKSYGTEVSNDHFWANSDKVIDEYGLITNQIQPNKTYDAIALMVAHNELIKLNLKTLLKPNGILYDVKGGVKEQVDGRL